LALAKLGADVKILTSIVSLPAEDLKRLEEAGIKIVKVPKIFANRFASPIFYSVYAKAKKEDRIVIGNGYTFGDDITWVHYPRLGALKYLSEFLNDKEKKMLRRESHVERVIFRSSKKLWAVSNLVKEVLVKEYNIIEDKVFVLHNGVDTERYRPLDEYERMKLREKLGIANNVKLLIFVGADPYRKGFHRILHALKKLGAYQNNYILYAIGFNPNNNILSLATDINVKFLGKISEEDLIRYYQVSDLLLLPSYYDPFPLVVLEAMACGVIPIVTPMVGASEIIIHGENGFIAINEEDLMNTLLEISSYDLEKLRKNAIATAHKYTWLNIAKLLLNRIEKSIA
jgi:UDP-glucose:(heptosyl)LPS alpha-1,3-glucosyltransferase